MSKLTRTSYKRKKIVMGLALFGAIGLVSTGFAAWVLSSSATKDAASQLNVGTVSENNMAFSEPVIYETGDADKTAINKFSFEPKEDDNTGRVRTDGTAQERLSLTVDATISQAQNLGKVTANIALADAAGTDFQEAVDKGYVVLPEAATAEVVLYNVTPSVTNPGGLVFEGDTVKTAKLSYEVAFEWGDFFGGQNPSVFFDSATVGGAAGDKAGTAFSDSEVSTILNDLHDLLDGVTLTLTLTALPN